MKPLSEVLICLIAIVNAPLTFAQQQSFYTSWADSQYHFMTCQTVRIKTYNQPGIATGSFFEFPNEKDLTILITNKHVAETEDSISLGIQLLDDNSKSVYGPYKTIQLYNKSKADSNFCVPSDTLIDLMAIAFKMPKNEMKNLRIKYWNLDALADISKLTPGMPVLIAGYPLGMVVNENQPLLLEGIIGGIDYVNNQIFLDADLFGGSSGSPVIVNIFTDFGREYFKENNVAIIGIVSNSIIKSKKLYNIETRQVEMIQYENAGISTVVGAKYIAELADKLLLKLKARK